jgi:hypothetical protein
MRCQTPGTTSVVIVWKLIWRAQGSAQARRTSSRRLRSLIWVVGWPPEHPSSVKLAMNCWTLYF